jgi:GNAT superfamily N-acetyltransferase
MQKASTAAPNKAEMMKAFDMSEEEYDEVARDMDFDLKTGSAHEAEVAKPLATKDNQSLFNGVECDPRIGAVTVEEAIETIALGYRGTATTAAEDLVSWVLGPRFANHNSHERISMCDYYGKYGAASCSKRGIMVGLRDPATSEVLGVMLLRRKPETDLEVYRTMMSAGYPPHLKKSVYGKEPLRREATVIKAQKKLAFKGPQYLLYNLAVKPAHQGKGCAAALVRALIALGERDGVPVCIYAGERLEAFYGRLGFEKQQLVEVVDPTGQAGSGSINMISMMQKSQP